MNPPGPSDDRLSGWRRVHLHRLARVFRGSRSAAAGRGWHWRKAPGEKTARLQIVSAHGVVWDFRLAGGAWIRKSEQQNL